MTVPTTASFITFFCIFSTSLGVVAGRADEKPNRTNADDTSERDAWFGPVPWYDRYTWKPEEHFQTAEMIEFCQAIQKNDLTSIRKLLKTGIDVNRTGKDNATLLLWAYSTPDTTCFRWLLEHGADPNIEFQSSFRTNFALIGAGVFGGDCITLVASRTPNRQRFDLVASHGGNLDFTHPEFGTTPLMEAAKVVTFPEIRRQRVARIIAAKVDLNRQLKNGTTAMSLALRDQRYDIVSMLLDAGADPNLFSLKNQQMLHRAAEQEFYREKSNRERREAGGVEIPFTEVDEWNQMITKMEKAAGYTLIEAHIDLQLQEEWREKGLGDFLLHRRGKIEKRR